MAKKEILDEAAETFESLEYEHQQEYIQRLTALADHKKQERVAALLNELNRLGVSAPTKKAVVDTDKRQRAPAKAKFRSKVNPELTWSGKGRTASWLAAEMEQTGEPMEAFLIND